MESSLIGIGLYTVGEAARLTGTSGPQIRRWLEGYRYRRASRHHSLPPVWRPAVPRLNGLVLSFNDLMELRFVREFWKLGISLQKIRRAIGELSRMVNAEYPFSQRKVVTDGLQLFAELRDENGGLLFYELTGSRNYAFSNVVYPMLKKGLVFDVSGRIARWYPDEDRFGKVLIDPRICFGHPVVEGTRIRAAILAGAYQAEQSFDRIAEWYEMDAALVRQAVHFHSSYPV